MHFFTISDAPAPALRGQTNTTRATAPKRFNRSAHAHATQISPHSAANSQLPPRSIPRDTNPLAAQKNIRHILFPVDGAASASKHSQKLRDAKSDL